MPHIKTVLDSLDTKARTSYRGYEAEKPFSLLEWSSNKYDYLQKCIDKRNQLIFRDEIYWVELGENLGSEESKLRPCVIIQNQKGNENAPTTLIAPITNATIRLPIAVEFSRGDNSDVTGTIDCGQIRVVSKGRIRGKITRLSSSEKKKVNNALLKSLGLFDVKIKLDRSNQKIRELNLEGQKKDSNINKLTKENEQLTQELEMLKKNLKNN